MIFNSNNSSQYFSFVCTQLNGFKHCYLMQIIQFNINNLLAQS